jgi:hypothetical protein
VRKAKFVRRLSLGGGQSADLLHLSEHKGDVVVHSWSSRALHVFSLNGRPLASVALRGRLSAMAVARDGQMLVGGSR